MVKIATGNLSFHLILSSIYHILIFLGFSAMSLILWNDSFVNSPQAVIKQWFLSFTTPEQAKHLASTPHEGGGDLSANQQLSTRQKVIWLSQPNSEINHPIDNSKNQQHTSETTPKTLTPKTLTQNTIKAKESNKNNAHSSEVKRRTVSVATMEAKDAEYINQWERHIETVGSNLYGQQIVDQQIKGQLTVSVSIKSNGELESVLFDQDNEHQIIGQWVKDIVTAAAPFEPFSENLQKSTDVLEIVRNWQFSDD